VDNHGPVCACGNVGCLEATFGGAALARDALAAARAGTSPALAERLATHGVVTARDVADGAAEGDVTCIQLIRDGGRRIGSVLASLVSFINPSMIVIGGGLAGLGHVLLAEIRSVVYRRSLPLATGNLPVVLTELGSRAGVAGAALLASETAYKEPA
jgi:predicted NBD/HSP70 family sugar kinase